MDSPRVDSALTHRSHPWGRCVENSVTTPDVAAHVQLLGVLPEVLDYGVLPEPQHPGFPPVAQILDRSKGSQPIPRQS